VENPDRWKQLAPDLQTLLTFLTDDHWELSFEHAPRVPEQHSLFPVELDARAEVALFSGGLDSVAGMLARQLAGRRRFIAVSACGNEVRGQAQEIALSKLRELGVDVQWVKIVHQLQRNVKRSRSSMETSQRSRGLLFLAMGASVASTVGVESFQVYETGIGCLNLPTSPAQVASQGTRAMHPATLTRVNRLFAKALDNPVRVVAPFFFLTKGELCRLVGRDLASLASVCSSCDEGEGHKPEAMAHCGLCTSCIFRRISIRAARMGDDPTNYRDVPTRRHGPYEIAAFELHAGELGRIARFDDLIAMDPNVRFALEAPSEVHLAPEAAKVAIVEMYHRYGQEIQDFLDHARPMLHSAIQPRAIEVDRDLFAAAR